MKCRIDKIIEYINKKSQTINDGDNYKIEINCAGKSLKISFTEFTNLNS